MFTNPVGNPAGTPIRTKVAPITLSVAGCANRNPPLHSPALIQTFPSNQPDELVYAMVKAVFDNIAVFRQLHPALSTLNIQEMVPSASVIPIHQGALNYFREVGLIH